MTSSQIWNKPLPNSNRMKTAFLTHSLLLAVASLFIGCAAGPSLRSADTDDAKIIVTEQGQILVHGEPVKLHDLHEIIADSSTESNELIVVQLPKSSKDEGMQRLMRAISREMTFARHYKYSFSTPPQAYAETYDKQTGTTTVLVAGQEVKRLETIAEKEAEVMRMEEENAAYVNGTYVSEAANQKPIEVYKGRKETEATPKREEQRSRQSRRSIRR